MPEAAMARTNRTGRSDKAARHVRLYHWLTNSAAWHDLKALERAIYCEIAKRYAGPGSNNGRIPYSVREAAAEFKVGPATALRALKSLQDHGFIVKVFKGAFSLKKRHATEWRLTEFSCDVTDALATKDFMRWQQPTKARSDKAMAGDTTGRATALFNGAPALSTEIQSKGNHDGDRSKGNNADSPSQRSRPHTLVN
jgi:DNA-binding transcriptional regulator YhcF (GntR family)